MLPGNNHKILIHVTEGRASSTGAQRRSSIYHTAKPLISISNAAAFRDYFRRIAPNLTIFFCKLSTLKYTSGFATETNQLKRSAKSSGKLWRNLLIFWTVFCWKNWNWCIKLRSSSPAFIRLRLLNYLSVCNYNSRKEELLRPIHQNKLFRRYTSQTHFRLYAAIFLRSRRMCGFKSFVTFTNVTSAWEASAAFAYGMSSAWYENWRDLSARSENDIGDHCAFLRSFLTKELHDSVHGRRL